MIVETKVEFIANNEQLHNWIEDNYLTVKQLNKKVIEIEGVGKFLLVDPKNIRSVRTGVLQEEIIFNDEFEIVLSDKENQCADLAGDIDYLLFQFGKNFYYSTELLPTEIKEFRWLGNVSDEIIPFPFLAIHSGFELCNGSGKYEDWCRKAKFLNIDTLGIAELNTLAGALSFQETAKKHQINPVIGETITILTETKGKVNIKLYVADNKGWINLLLINKKINVDNEGSYIKEEELFSCNTEGLICVLSPEINLDKYFIKFKNHFTSLFYQVDIVEWDSDSKDEEWLLSLKDYFDNYIDKIKPVLIADAYYIEKENYKIKSILNSIGKVGFKNNSKQQYFKNLDELLKDFLPLFKDEERATEIFFNSVENLYEITSKINFSIPVKFFRLPEYEVKQSDNESDTESLFFALIEEGLNEKIISKGIDPEPYLDRLNEEIEVIKEGGFIDYFLALHDIINYCKKEGIVYGVGRGSAAGALTSFVLDIVGIDPLEYGLLFSRFLNKGRIGKQLPDVDLDFQGSKRDQVKRYMEERYGKDYVASIGTYSTFKLKSGLKDLARNKGIDFSKVNYIASLIEDAELSFTDFFKLAQEKEDIKTFIQKHPDVIEQLPVILNQSKASSIHASGVVVVPKKYGTIYEQMPVKKIDENLVTEWSGTDIDTAGFLKFDILGVKQLDKIADIFQLIEKRTGKKPSFEEMELDNDGIYKMFQDGNTEDVFQFGTEGLKQYCKELKPNNINDLIAAVALYRPGTMDTGMHKKYIDLAHGKEKPTYDIGCYEATKNTFGIAIYQEQVMQITKDVAGFDLVMADDVRKAMGKKDHELLETYKDKFVQGGIKNGHEKESLIALWEKLESFASYGFNKSHAACYAITGYYTQWLKYNYPLEFWTISLQYSDDKEIINRISEILKTSKIKLSQVEINFSTKQFIGDVKKQTIYWALNSVSHIGEVASNEILEEREKNGEFYSIEDFCDRVSSKVNKRCITNLILSGAFDSVEKIYPNDRFELLKKYYTFIGSEMSEELQEISKWKDYQFTLKQKDLSGFGFLDYKSIIQASKTFSSKANRYREIKDVISLSSCEEGDEIIIAGILNNCYDKPFKGGVRGKLGANLELIDNTDPLRLTIWMDHWMSIAEEVINAKGKILIISGKITFNNYKNSIELHSNTRTKIEVI